MERLACVEVEREVLRWLGPKDLLRYGTTSKAAWALSLEWGLWAHVVDRSFQRATAVEARPAGGRKLQAAAEAFFHRLGTARGLRGAQLRAAHVARLVPRKWPTAMKATPAAPRGGRRLAAVSAEQLSAGVTKLTYRSRGDGDDAASVGNAFFGGLDRAVLALPAADRAGEPTYALRCCGYFEVEVEARGNGNDSGCVAIGLCKRGFPGRNRQPGWCRRSWGYHGDDGHVFHAGAARDFEWPRFGAGDTVGCGVLLHEPHLAASSAASVFFTHNGKFLGVAHTIIPPRSNRRKYKLYPVVGLDTASLSATVNFGLARPFLFDVDASPCFHVREPLQDSHRTWRRGVVARYAAAAVARDGDSDAESPSPSSDSTDTQTRYLDSDDSDDDDDDDELLGFDNHWPGFVGAGLVDDGDDGGISILGYL
ncbi:hypothetical protein M885DRAFT_512882 [Pelagophyceae sp. CCMP2097]|nr:hypothetical protein M885DRAFT_512882 [Pelagophyceae sp. CCMP2097]